MVIMTVGEAWALVGMVVGIWAVMGLLMVLIDFHFRIKEVERKCEYEVASVKRELGYDIERVERQLALKTDLLDQDIKWLKERSIRDRAMAVSRN